MDDLIVIEDVDVHAALNRDPDLASRKANGFLVVLLVLSENDLCE